MRTPWLARIVGLIIAIGAFSLAALLWWAINAVLPDSLPSPAEVAGNLDTLDPAAASSWVGIAVLAGTAVALALAATLVAAGTEALWDRHIQRTTRTDRTPLAPTPVLRATADGSGGAGRPVTITALIPAHNEQATLAVTLPALLAQSRPPDRVLVVADNCTDGTEAVAAAHRVTVVRTVDNRERKAGALNQVLADLLPALGHNDLILVMDADTHLDPGFLAVAETCFAADRALMALGGVFHGEPGHGLLGMFQRNEFQRYARTIARRGGRVFVLTGTSTVFRAPSLRTVAEARGTLIPGTPGRVYDTVALTEDNELTIALKSLGATLTSPAGCTVVTELMPTWRALWAQRMRWQRGAVENIGAYGVTPATFRYWSQQMAIGYGVIALGSYLLLMTLLALSPAPWTWIPFWLAVGAVFAVERTVTVWPQGVRARLLAVLLIPELLYDMYLNVVFVVGVAHLTARRRARWGHVEPDRAQGVVPLGAAAAGMGSAPGWVALQTFVAVNSLVYAALAIGKLLPKPPTHRLGEVPGLRLRYRGDRAIPLPGRSAPPS
ncbi:MAG: glycosyltransferase family 2 protein [Candidatus Nanopelagicales bacterium]